MKSCHPRENVDPFTTGTSWVPGLQFPYVTLPGVTIVFMFPFKKENKIKQDGLWNDMLFHTVESNSFLVYINKYLALI